MFCRAKAELEERMVKVGRERADLALQLKENEEEMQELIKKYKVAVKPSLKYDIAQL